MTSSDQGAVGHKRTAQELDALQKAHLLPTGYHPTYQVTKLQLPEFVLDGIKDVGRLGPCPECVSSNSNSARWPTSGSVVRDAILEVRGIARTAQARHTLGQQLRDPADGGGHSSAAARSGRAGACGAAAEQGTGTQWRRQARWRSPRHPLFMRARLLRSRLPLQQLSGPDGTIIADVDMEAEDEGGSDDDSEFDLPCEPLRVKGAQVDVAGTVRRRPETPPPLERAMVNLDLWVPDAAWSWTPRRVVQELQLRQPYRVLLSPSLRDVGHMMPGQIKAWVGYHPDGYVPHLQHVKALHAAYRLQVHRLVDAISADTAVLLGLRALSPTDELSRWEARNMGDLKVMEHALASKREGLEIMRLERLPYLRLYDVASFYYKVWRTLATPAAQEYYLWKLAERKRNLKLKPSGEDSNLMFVMQEVANTLRAGSS